jgi:hypothetical protein
LVPLVSSNVPGIDPQAQHEIHSSQSVQISRAKLLQLVPKPSSRKIYPQLDWLVPLSQRVRSLVRIPSEAKASPFCSILFRSAPFCSDPTLMGLGPAPGVLICRPARQFLSGASGPDQFQPAQFFFSSVFYDSCKYANFAKFVSFQP